MRLPLPFDVHGDALGVRKDVLLDGDGDVLEWVVHQEVTGDVGGEGFDEVAGAIGCQSLDLKGNCEVVDGARNLVSEAIEVLRWRHFDRHKQGLWVCALFVWNADEAGDAEAANFDLVGHADGGWFNQG